ncbi:glycosyltransferase [Alicyclobacillus dauci]|uniref:Glycosyltransferase n=1 Tax=Alicyclobacillus dauci TaxID=1475485 RepID=A0ABY6Z9A6_9BACL|nr:glycosyltransferase [Alicyclobacillus dauci]WAH39462.1 glycosyltransferase [Alicyclobacillus dauci]
MESNLRVLMILDSFLVGGTETHVFTLTRELLKQGVHVVVLGDDGPLHQLFLELGCPVYVLDFDQENRAQINSDLNQIVNNEGINLIHAHQTGCAPFAISLAKDKGIPFLFSVHGSYYKISTLADMAEQAAFISVSPAIQNWLWKHRIPSILIPNGIDTDYYRLQPIDVNLCREYGIPTNVPIVVYAGRLSWEKADIAEEVIQACAYLREREGFPNLHLLIVGDGWHSDGIRALATRRNELAGTDFIHLAGSMRDVRPFYALGDCVVGTGRVALEAMSCKRPVVAVGSRGFFGLVTPDVYIKAWYYYFGDHKRLYARSSDMLANEIKNTILSSERARRSWGTQGRRFVKYFFDIRSVTVDLLHLYKLLYNKSGSAR